MTADDLAALTLGALVGGTIGVTVNLATGAFWPAVATAAIVGALLVHLARADLGGDA